MNPRVVEEPGNPGDLPRAGTVDQLAGYVHAVAEASAAEVFIDWQQTTSEVGTMLDLAERLLSALGAQA